MFFFENLFNNIALELTLLGSKFHNIGNPDKQDVVKSEDNQQESLDVTWIYDMFAEFAGYKNINYIPDDIMKEISGALTVLYGTCDLSESNRENLEDDIYAVSALILAGVKDPIHVCELLDYVDQYDTFESFSEDYPDVSEEQFNSAKNAMGALMDWVATYPDKEKIKNIFGKKSDAAEKKSVITGTKTPKSVFIKNTISEISDGLKYVLQSHTIPDEMVVEVQKAANEMYEDCKDTGVLYDKYDDSDLRVIEVLISLGYKNVITIFKTVNVCNKFEDMQSTAKNYPNMTIDQYNTAMIASAMYTKWATENPEKVVRNGISTKNMQTLKPFNVDDQDNSEKKDVEKSTSKTKTAAPKKETKSASKKTDKAAAPAPVPATV